MRHPEWHAVRSPWSGDVVGEVELAQADDVALAVNAARSLLLDRAARPPVHQRAAILRRAAERLRGHHEALANLIAREGGKPLIDARVEVTRAALGLDWLAGDLERLHGTEIPLGASPATEGRLAFTLREPIGVVAAVSAFNHPLNLIVHQAGAAVAAGCPVIVKPALETPFSAFALADAFHEAGLPEGWLRVLPCSNAVAEALVASHGLAYLSFVGSARVGWALRAKLAPGVRCALEHGGAAPVIVDEGADLEAVTALLLKGGYYHAGQVCVSVQRVFAHRTLVEALVERLAVGVRALKVGDPTFPTTEVGPLIRPAEVQRVQAWVEEAVQGGARLVAGGEAFGAHAFHPTLLHEPPDQSRVMQEEVFGPVVSVAAFDDRASAVARANGTRWAFQAAVFTPSLERALWYAEQLDASAVMINDHTAFRADWMPFGGRRESGLGVGGLPASLHELCPEKLVVVRRG